MAHLTLTFYGNDFRSDFFRLMWSGEKPLLRARLSPEKEKIAVYTDLIASSRSPNESVFFATGTDTVKEHQYFTGVLKALKEPFQEKVMIVGNPAFGISRHHEQSDLVFGATKDSETIEKVFRSYLSWHGLSWPFFFIVAEREPSSWKEQVEPIVSRISMADETPILQDSLIKNSRLIMITEFEYSLVVFSDKMSEKQLADIASTVATQHHLDFLVERDEQERKESEERKLRKRGAKATFRSFANRLGFKADRV